MSNLLTRWARKIFNLVGVRAKIMGIVMLLVLLLGSLLSLQAKAAFDSEMRRQLEKQGVSLGQYLAVRSEKLLLTGDIYGLHELIKDTMNNNPELRYIMITDPGGRLVSDSFGDSIPKGLLNFNSFHVGESYSIKSFITEQGRVQDVAVPIMNGKIGQARLGISEAGIAKTVITLQRSLWLSILVIFIFGMTLAYFLATLISNPLKLLVLATEKIGAGQLDYRVPLDWVTDELGQLAVSFNSMIEKLQETEKERATLWEEVRRKEEMRRYLLKKVISAQEEERLRISRELHDETGQALSSVNLALASLQRTKDPSELSRKIKLVQDTVMKALENIHLLSTQLRPSILDRFGLPAAVRRFVEECSTRWGKKIGFTCIDFDFENISSETKIAAYRITQEALTNAMRHAAAENISIVLNKTEQKVIIIVEDDGTGFDMDEVEEKVADAKHLGIFGMRERAEMLGGGFTLETSFGSGTTVYVELPLEVA